MGASISAITFTLIDPVLVSFDRMFFSLEIESDTNGTLVGTLAVEPYGVL